MSDFNLKQWLFENKLGAYEKASRLKEFNSEDGFSDETANRDDMNEVNPAALGVGQAEADAEMQKQDDLNSDWLSLANETVGWATIEKPAMESEGAMLDTYLSKLEKHDAYYRMSDDPRTYNRGQAEDKELRQLYSQLSDMEKQTALDAALEMSEKYWPTDKYPGMGDLRRTWTTKTFDGDI
jgi:hypothetical protein